VCLNYALGEVCVVDYFNVLSHRSLRETYLLTYLLTQWRRILFEEL